MPSALLWNIVIVSLTVSSLSLSLYTIPYSYPYILQYLVAIW